MSRVTKYVMTPGKTTAFYAVMYRKAFGIVRKLGLPPKLLYLMANDKLEAEVQRAHAEIDRLNALLDDWEIANPAAAALAPWVDTRQAWKDAGRPRAAWYDVIRWSMKQANAPLRANSLVMDLYKISQSAWMKQKTDRRIRLGLRPPRGYRKPRKSKKTPN